MKINLPVTQTERLLKDGEFIVSKTDLKGVITYVNGTFLEISGYSEAELIGKAHNIVRHPDMPAAGFQDLWDTLHKGKPWTGAVKNRCKNGDFYWVLANAAPILENGQVTGYISVRTTPSRALVEACENIYRAVRENRAGDLIVLEGAAVSGAWPARIQRAMAGSSLRSRLIALAGFAALPPFINAACDGDLAWPAALLSLTLGLAGAWFINGSMTRHLSKIRSDMQEIAQGNMSVATEAGADNEVGFVASALKSLHIRVGFDLAETRRMAEESQRIRVALDHVSANVMMADNGRNIIYCNKSVVTLFQNAEADIRKQLPDFDASKLLGANIDGFHKNPSHQANLLATFNSTYQSSLNIGGRFMEIVANPVVDCKGNRLGAVIEWSDRTSELAIEREVSSIVDGAAHGDFSSRIDLNGKTGFYKQLSVSLNHLMEISQTGLQDIGRMLDAMADGNLNEKITQDYQGSFGQLKDSANVTAENLKDLVAQIQDATSTINTAAREIASGNTDLSQRTEEQASSLEETASSMEELTATVRQNADNVRQANQLAIGASDVANKGGKVVGMVVETMEGIAESSSKISDIISTIDGIAFQTNILALNAAVEAARAGELGRGFAVVAGEVRSLAQRSANAAKEIKQLINDSVQRISEGLGQTDEAGESMKEIVSAIGRVTDIMSEISAASAEQSAGIGQINHAITQMDEGTQQNAALVEQAAAAAESLEEQAQHLSGLVGNFRLDVNVGRLVGRRADLPLLNAPGLPLKQDPRQFDEMIKAHQAWKDKLRNYLAGKGDKLDPKVVCLDNKCALGLWIYGDAKKTMQGDEEYEALRHSHAGFHQCAADVIRKADKGERQDAEHILIHQFSELSTETIGHIRQMKKMYC
jgi:methyl-accepting chemotaxis protein